MALLRPLLNLFSSVRLGITLMVLIFLYSAVGSAGLPVHWNVLRPDAWLPLEAFDLSEFRWFNWWPFALLMGLFCSNLSVTTIRRIPFNRINLGVWMIHSGLIILSVGSVWYFGVKVEGDTLVHRRALSVSWAGEQGHRRGAREANQFCGVLTAAGQMFEWRRLIPKPPWKMGRGRSN